MFILGTWYLYRGVPCHSPPISGTFFLVSRKNLFEHSISEALNIFRPYHCHCGQHPCSYPPCPITHWSIDYNTTPLPQWRANHVITQLQHEWPRRCWAPLFRNVKKTLRRHLQKGHQFCRKRVFSSARENLGGRGSVFGKVQLKTKTLLFSILRKKSRTFRKALKNTWIFWTIGSSRLCPQPCVIMWEWFQGEKYFVHVSLMKCPKFMKNERRKEEWKKEWRGVLSPFTKWISSPVEQISVSLSCEKTLDRERADRWHDTEHTYLSKFAAKLWDSQVCMKIRKKERKKETVITQDRERAS